MFIIHLRRLIRVFHCCTVCEMMKDLGLLIIRGKKSQILRDFWRQIRGENGRFRGNFAEISLKNKEESQEERFQKKKDILEGCQIQGKKENTKVHPTQFSRQLYLFRATTKT